LRVALGLAFAWTAEAAVATEVGLGGEFLIVDF
jgi:hypothetical protein